MGRANPGSFLDGRLTSRYIPEEPFPALFTFRGSPATICNRHVKHVKVVHRKDRFRRLPRTAGNIAPLDSAQPEEE